jgi:hypothetical protein
MMRSSASLVVLGLVLLGCQVAFSDGAEPHLVALPIGMWPANVGLLSLGIGLFLGLLGGTARYRSAVALALLGTFLAAFAVLFLSFTNPSAPAPVITVNDVAFLLALVTWAVAIYVGFTALRSQPRPRDLRYGRAVRALVIGPVLAAVLAGCGGPPGTLFRATLSDLGGGYPLPVTLGDTTGLVLGVRPGQFDPADFRDAGILADPGESKAFIVTWLGGACDSDAVLAFRTTGSGYDIELGVHEKLGLGCIAVGILRGLRIETSAPISLSTITISGAKRIELRRADNCGPLTDAATDDAKIACGSFIEATVGDRVDVYASVTVRPVDGGCRGSECSTAEGISARTWRVEATDRQGQPHVWRCIFHDDSATCTPVSNPSPP